MNRYRTLPFVASIAAVLLLAFALSSTPTKAQFPSYASQNNGGTGGGGTADKSEQKVRYGKDSRQTGQIKLHHCNPAITLRLNGLSILCSASLA